MAFRRAGLPHGHGELQSRDRLHRLRHLRRALLRAAHARGRAGDRARRAAARRRGAARRADAAPPGAGARAGGRAGSSAPRPRRSTSPRTAAGSRRSPASSAWRSRRAAWRTRSRRRSRVASRVGYPVLVRPSYVLGGRAMEIVYDDGSLRSYFARAARVAPEHPVLIDSFLEDAFEADVDAIADGTRCVIGGVMQHIEDAGIHSGDSACVLPPVPHHRGAGARRCGGTPGPSPSGSAWSGCINVQYAIKDGVVYVLEVNPRGSRTVPFVSKTTGVPLAQPRGGGHGGPDARRAGPPGRRPPALRRGEGGGLPLQQAARGGPGARARRCARPAR